LQRVRRARPGIAVGAGADQKLNGLVRRRVSPLGVEVVEEPAGHGAAGRAQLDARRLIVAIGRHEEELRVHHVHADMIAGEIVAVAVHGPELDYRRVRPAGRDVLRRDEQRDERTCSRVQSGWL
jgi:hypothetical protein